MKAAHLINGTVAAGLAAAFLAGAVSVQHVDIDSSRYILSSDAITAIGAVAGALFVALAVRLFYLGARPR